MCTGGAETDRMCSLWGRNRERCGRTKSSELVKTLSRDCEEWYNVSWPEETAGIENGAEITEGFGR